MDSPSPPATDVAEPRWQPLGHVARRVVGVLIEKAKTTPDAYPLTLNSLTTGCNQKSNRDPQMSLDADDVEACLESLRESGAIVEIAGSGRVSKFRHLMYTWLGVDKVELAVMGELLLRGVQTVGELRGRAARMEPIADLAALKLVLESLIQKRLVVPLTPEGRGQLVTHNLYPPDELARVKAKSGASQSPAAQPTRPVVPTRPEPPRSQSDTATPPHTSGASHASDSVAAGSPTAKEAVGHESRIDAELLWLRGEIEDLRKELVRLQTDISDLWKNLS